MPAVIASSYADEESHIAETKGRGQLDGVLSIELVLARSRASYLEGVKKLNVWHNKIHDISIVESLPNLQILNLSSNNISSLRSLRDCSSLSELYLRRNNISSSLELDHLRGCVRLRSAWFAGNPFCQDYASIADYRLAVIKALPQLTFLDNVSITNDEKTQASVALALNGEDVDSTVNGADSTPISSSGDGGGGGVGVGCFFQESSRSSNLLNASLTKSVVVDRISVSGDEWLESDSDSHFSVNGRGLNGTGFGKDLDNDDTENANDDEDGDENEGTKSTSNAEMLESSLRFFLAESNSIRETLGLQPIATLTDHDDGDNDDDTTIDDVDSGAADDDDDENDEDEDDLDLLNSYADVLDDDGEDIYDDYEGEEGNDEEEEEESLPKSSASTKSGSRRRDLTSSKSTSIPAQNRSTLLTATLLMLQNLTMEELREVEREAVQLRTGSMTNGQVEEE